MPNPPKPIEVKRKLGNPGGRPLPKPIALRPGQPTTSPDPHRPLGAAGRAVWDALWTAGAVWLSRTIDAELVLMVAELADERQGLRLQVLRDRDWHDRNGLRQLDDQVLETLSLLGFNPTARARLGIAFDVPAPSAFDDLARRRPPPVA